MEYRQIKAEDIDRNEQGGYATPRTVAKDLGIYAQLIYSWGNRGHVRLYRIGSKIFVDPKEVTTYHEKHKPNAKSSPFVEVDGVGAGDFVSWDTKRGWARIALIVGVSDLLVDMVDALGNTLSFRTIKVQQMLSTGELAVVQPEQVMELVAEHYQQKGLPLDELLRTARNAWKTRGLHAEERGLANLGLLPWLWANMLRVLAVVAIVVAVLATAFLPSFLARPVPMEVPGYPTIVCVRYLAAMSCLEVWGR